MESMSARRMRLRNFMWVCLGQLIVGAFLQVMLFVLARHDVALSVMAAWLLGMGAFGLAFYAQAGDGRKPGTSVVIVSVLAALVAAAIPVVALLMSA